MDLQSISKVDPAIAEALSNELIRQRETLELIASENIASPEIMAVQGSILTNKYAEGYPKRRYYGGCEFVDIAEQLAIDRAMDLFEADYANVQPHSGSQANMAVYFALLEHGDTVLGMNLSHGGHLTHGSKVSFSGKLYNFVHYGIKEDTGLIDYEEVARKAKQYKPKLIVAGASAYPRIIDFYAFAEIAKSAGALLMVDMAHIAGLVAARVHPSPVPVSDIVTSTTHKTLRGPRGGLILAKKNLGKNLDKQIFPGMQGGALMHVVAAKALAFKEANSESYRIYQENIVENAKAIAETLLSEGITLVSGGTDNHMVLVDLRNIGLTGNVVEEVLEKAGITVNKNSIPFESLPPTITSGIRIGTPSVTTRGMGAPEMKLIAKFIVLLLRNHQDENLIQQTRNKVRELCESFPIYPEMETI